MPLEKNQPVDRNKRLVVQKRGYMSRAHATVHHTTLHASYTAFFFSRTRRRAAYHYIKKNGKRWSYSITNKPTPTHSNLVQKPLTSRLRNLTLDQKKKQEFTHW